MHEFSTFIDVLETLHFQYLHAKGAQEFRAFWGRKQDYLLEDLPVQDAASNNRFSLTLPSLQIGFDPDCSGTNPLPPGWWPDFKYYSANNHPLHGIFQCDPLHPFSWLERLAVEISTIVFSYFTTSEGGNVFLVAVLGTVIWWALFLMFTTPCLRRDKSKTNPRVYRRSRLGSILINLCGYSAVLSSCIILLIFGRDKLKSDSGKVMQGRALSYIYSWLLALGVYFNIFIAWGQPDLHGTFSIGDKIADLVGLGQWRVEKRRFQNLRKKSAMPTSRADTPVQAGLLPEAIAAPFDAFAKAALDMLGEADASDQRPPLPELPEDPALPALKEQAREAIMRSSERGELP
jgi:hypothetical protein